MSGVKYVNYILCLCVVGLMSSCYTMRDIGLLQERSSLPTYEDGEYMQYKLRVTDEVLVRVITADKATMELFQSSSSGQSTNMFSYPIFEDGTILLPFISSVKVSGLTLEEAERAVQSQLVEIAPDAQVKMALSTSTFCVIGEANRGYFPIYKERLTIYQALALSGGLLESANYSQVKIIRETDEGTKIVSFDIRSKSLIDSEYYYIYPNDIIYVDVAKKRFWAVNSYTGFLGVITSSLTLLLSVWSLIGN